MNAVTVTRRGILAAGLGGAGTVILADCSGDAGKSSLGDPNDRAALPSYSNWNGVKPDLPSVNGSAPGFLAYPSSPAPITTSPPSGGDKVRVLSILTKPPVQLDRNQYWRHLNDQLGTEIQFEGAPNASYPAKFQTVMAGDDLPDIMQIRFTIPKVPAFLEARCQDLTELLAGEGVKKYPGLANLPTDSWRTAMFGGRIYGVPCPSNSLFTVPVVRGDALATAGVPADVGSGAELMDMLRALNNPRANQWATTVPFDMLAHVNQMVGTPNTWGVDGGRFKKDYETNEFKRALSLVATMWKENLFHPDSFVSSKVQSSILTWFINGTVKFFVTSPYWGGTAQAVQEQDQSRTVVPVATPRWDGGGLASRYLVKAATSVAALKKADSGRIEELLRIIDWCAAPFGTAEHRTRKFGVEGVHYELDGTDPILTDRGKAEVIAETTFIGSCLNPHYRPGRPDLVKSEHASEVDGLAQTIALPTVGLYSPTDESEGPAADAKMRDLQADIIQGRKHLSDWDPAVAAWKRTVGDKIRSEYEAAYEEGR